MDSIDDLIGELYELAAGSDDWSPFVERLAETFDAPFTSLRARSRSSALTTIASAGVGARNLAAYSEYFHQLDPLKQRLLHLAPGTTVVIPDVSRDPAVTDGEYYQDFLRPMGCAHLFGVWSSHDDDGVVGLGLGRAATQRGFSAEEQESLGKLGSHLGRASRLRVKLAQPDADSRSLAEFMPGFGLTPKEAEVAAEMVRGNSVTGIATILGIGRETVRFHLRSIFQKTDTHSQAQLVSRLLLASRRH